MLRIVWNKFWYRLYVDPTDFFRLYRFCSDSKRLKIFDLEYHLYMVRSFAVAECSVLGCIMEWFEWRRHSVHMYDECTYVYKSVHTTNYEHSKLNRLLYTCVVERKSRSKFRYRFCIDLTDFVSIWQKNNIYTKIWGSKPKL